MKIVHDGRYDRITIVLHWATAALVLLLWVAAQVIDLFPKGEPRVYMRSVHIVLGVAFALVLVWRLAWRATGGRRLAASRSLRRVSSGVHLLLYALLVGEVLLGLCNVWVRGDSIFDLIKVTAYAGVDNSLRHTVASVHRWTGHLVIAIACLHALAALFHHHVLRDGVLARMWPRRGTAG
jgi:cytochrome b561